MNRHKYRGLLSVGFVFLLLFSFAIPFVRPQTAEALSYDLRALNRVRIRMESIGVSQNDWNELPSRARDAFGSREQLNSVLDSLFKDKDFEDRDIWDSNMDYRLETTYEGKTCTSIIDGFDNDNPTKANVELRFAPPRTENNRDCIDVDTDDVSVENHDQLWEAFAWVDESTIRAYQRNDWFFVRDGNGDKFYLESEEGESCQDYIQVESSNSGLWISACFEAQAVQIGSPENRSVPPGEGTRPSGDGEGESEPTCEENLQAGGGFGWVICPVLSIVDGLANELIDQIDTMLTVDDNDFNQPELEQAWSYFRNIASFALIIIGLVMIIGQAVSKG